MLRETRARGPFLESAETELFEPEIPFVKLRPAYSEKLVLSNAVKGIEIEITAKFRTYALFRCEDTKRMIVTRNAPEKLRDF